MALFSLASISAFVKDPDVTSMERLGLAFTLMLTATAYSLVIAEKLPTLGYLTFLDKYILATFGFIAIVAAEILVVEWFATDAIEDEGGTMDLIAIIDVIVWGLFHIALILYVRIYVLPAEQSKEDEIDVDRLASGVASAKASPSFDVQEMETFAVDLAAPLGLTFNGNATSGMTVKNVRKKGSAHASGAVTKGMKILSVDGNSTSNKTKEEVVSMFKAISGPVPVTFERVAVNKTPVATGNEEKWIAKFPFQAVHKSEISFKAGDIIVDVARFAPVGFLNDCPEEAGWCIGKHSISGRTGRFPFAFVNSSFVAPAPGTSAGAIETVVPGRRRCVCVRTPDIEDRKNYFVGKGAISYYAVADNDVFSISTFDRAVDDSFWYRTNVKGSSLDIHLSKDFKSPVAHGGKKPIKGTIVKAKGPPVVEKDVEWIELQDGTFMCSRSNDRKGAVTLFDSAGQQSGRPIDSYVAGKEWTNIKWEDIKKAPAVLAEPINANEKLTGNVEGCITVVERGGNTFGEKAKFVQEAGAIAVIFVNANKATDTTEAIFHPNVDGKNDQNVTIPVFGPLNYDEGQ